MYDTGVNLERDLVLILDVARFKYPPFWVPMHELWEAMATNDAVTSEPRGYFVVNSKSASAVDTAFDQLNNQQSSDIIHSGVHPRHESGTGSSPCKGCKH